MKTIRAGKLLGVPLMVNPSWFLLVGLILWVLSTRVYPQLIPNANTSVHVLMAVTSVVAFFGSIVLHELAHSLVAKQQRIPVRNITLFVFGGVSQITSEPKRPLAELWMAFAGPLTSAILAVLCLLAWWGVDQAGGPDPVAFVLFWLGTTNAVLAVFNLIPAYPMDGGRVFRALVWMITGNYQRATAIASWTGRGFGWAMIGAGCLAVIGFDMKIVNDASGGLWMVLIGFFLENSARQGLAQTRLISLLRQYSARDLMNDSPPVVDGTVSVASLARGVLDINPRVCYFVEDEGRLAGILSAYQMRAVPEPLWDRTTASEAMSKRQDLRATPPEQLANDILLEMETEDLTHMPVVQDGRVVGVVGRDRILGVIRQAGMLRGI